MLVDERLYLPRKWIDNKARCLKAKIPLEEIKFRTKYELGLESKGLTFVANVASILLFM